MNRNIMFSGEMLQKVQPASADEVKEKSPNDEACKMLVQALVISQLDY